MHQVKRHYSPYEILALRINEFTLKSWHFYINICTPRNVMFFIKDINVFLKSVKFVFTTGEHETQYHLVTRLAVHEQCDHHYCFAWYLHVQMVKNVAVPLVTFQLNVSHNL